ncbi:muts domain V-domain-containing protein [Limtongia smithiae]|uniref:muts domain V-domain-containing protein n=1 Tax=Limtongia smithiae TaxID=1125753 RepID=UPI0034CFC67F
MPSHKASTSSSHRGNTLRRKQWSPRSRHSVSDKPRGGSSSFSRNRSSSASSRQSSSTAQTKRLSAVNSASESSYVNEGPGQYNYLDERSRSTNSSGSSISRPYSAMSTRSAATATSTPRVICAVSEGRGVASMVGLCFLSVDTGECVVCELADTQTFVRTLHKISVYQPIEILFPSSADNFTEARVIGVPRRFYNENDGREYISDLTFPKDVNDIRVLTAAKFYATCALSAVLKYIDVHMNLKFARHSLRIRYEGSEGSMMIDNSTVKYLELLQNLDNVKSQYSLFGILKNTGTPMGVRLLRAQILQPLTDIPTLEARYDALEELTQNEELFFSCQSSLAKFHDLDRLLTSLVSLPAKEATVQMSEQRINDIILLKDAVARLQQIEASLRGVRSDLLAAIKSLCADPCVAEVQALINSSINEDCNWAKTAVELRNQRCYAVKQGRNGFLDVARQTYNEVTEDVLASVARLKETYEDLESMEVKFEIARGYYLRVPVHEEKNRGMLPAEFVDQVVVRKQHIECTTMELKKFNGKLKDALSEIMLMSEQTVESLVEEIRAHIPGLYKACEGVGMLDMLVSFAHVATSSEQGYVRPIIVRGGDCTDGEDEDRVLAVKNARHPVKEIVMQRRGSRFVGNDIYVNNRTSRFQIITGTNMSGKSTYIRQVALLCILAQMGSFVPAEQAQFPIFKCLHARISTNEEDDMQVPSLAATSTGAAATQTSTFATDMREAAFILANANANGLLLVDEMGRGSSVQDGLAVTLAIAEQLVETRAVVVFVTHFTEIAEVLGTHSAVANLHMCVEMEERRGGGSDGAGKMKMLYKIADGTNTETGHYGLRLAELVPLPRGLLRRAGEIAEMLLERRRRVEEEGAEGERGKSKTMIAKRRKSVVDLYSNRFSGGEGRAEEEQNDRVLGGWLCDLQARFVERMSE